MDSDAKCNALDRLGSQAKCSVSVSNPQVSRNFDGNPVVRREAISSRFNGVRRCTSRQNSGSVNADKH